MFQRIHFSHINDRNEPIFTVVDSCFSFNITGDSPELYDIVTYSVCVEALIAHYESKRLNVAKNLALYYKWMTDYVYGNTLIKGKAVTDLWLNSHREELTRDVPHLQFGKKYYNSIIQYLISMSCYQ
jgi:hypothetical protein